MALTVSAPKPPARVSPVDAQDIASVANRMLALAEEINAMAVNVAKARAIREYDSDRRKRSLALHVREFLVGNSATAAETLGRASPRYGEELAALQDDLTQAEQTIQQYDAARIAFDAQRSALAALRHAAETY